MNGMCSVWVTELALLHFYARMLLISMLFCSLLNGCYTKKFYIAAIFSK